MYVADVTDVQELLELRAEAEDELIQSDYMSEQAAWDLEDIENRLWELGAERASWSERRNAE